MEIMQHLEHHSQLGGKYKVEPILHEGVTCVNGFTHQTGHCYDRLDYGVERQIDSRLEYC